MKRNQSKESLYSVTSEVPCSETFALGDYIKAGDRIGRVAFMGRTEFQPGDWIGVILDTPDGKNNGSVNGIKYFECKEKHGLFCRPGKLLKLQRTLQSPTLSHQRAASPTNSIAFSITPSITASQIGGSKEHSPYATEYGYDIGDRVQTADGRPGKVKFLNVIRDQIYAGLLFDKPLGDSDGKFQGIQYFKCYPKYAAFLPASEIKKPARAETAALPPKIAPRQTKASQLRLEKGATTGETATSGGARMGRWGSRESLDSHISTSKLRTPPPKASIGKQPNMVKDCEIVASLKKCLQEKEAHLVRLTNELDERNSDTDRFAQENMSLKLRVGELDAELDAFRRDNAELQRIADERDKKLDDLSFCFTEAELQKEELEQKLKELKQDAMKPLLEVDEEDEQAKETDPTLRSEWTQTSKNEKFESCGSQTDEESRIDLVDCRTQTDIPLLRNGTVQTEVEARAWSNAETQSEDPSKMKIAEIGIQTDKEKRPEGKGQQNLRITEYGVETEEMARVERLHAESQTEWELLVNEEVQTEERTKGDAVVQTEGELKLQNHIEVQTENYEAKETLEQEIQTNRMEQSDNAAQTEKKNGKEAAVQTEQTNMPNSPTISFHSNPSSNKENSAREVVELNVSKLSLNTDASSSSGPLLGQFNSNDSEDLRRKFEEKCEEASRLEQANQFLNRIIYDKMEEIKQLKRLQERDADNGTEATRDGDEKMTISAAIPSSKPKARRLFCEHCDRFDWHDTAECPKEEARKEERRTHSAISPRKLQSD